MVYMKHPIFGNRHVPESEVDARRAVGWVKWPRTLSEKQAEDRGFLPHSELVQEQPKKPGRKPKK